MICVVLLGGDLRLRGRGVLCERQRRAGAHLHARPARQVTACPAFAGLVALVGLADRRSALGARLLARRRATRRPCPRRRSSGRRWTSLFLRQHRRGRDDRARAAGRVPRSFATEARSRRSIERSTYLARALPGIVVALAFVFFATRYAAAVYQSTFLLIAALRRPLPAAGADRGRGCARPGAAVARRGRPLARQRPAQGARGR